MSLNVTFCIVLFQILQKYPKEITMSSTEEVKAGAKGEKFMKKAEREQCWKARDAFWDCMNSNGEKAELCKSTRAAFEKMCPGTWVKHFDRKFDYDKFKRDALEMGYQKIDDEFTSKKKKFV